MSDQALPKKEPNNEQITSPPTFADGQGNTWQIKLTLGLADEVQESCQVDLLPDDNDLSPVVAACLSFRKFSKILWACIQGQAEAKGITQQSFVKSLGAEELQAGAEALRGAIDFFIRRTKGDQQADVAMGVWDAAMQMADAGARAFLEAVNSTKTKEAMQTMFDEATVQAHQEIQASLGGRGDTATTSPA